MTENFNRIFRLAADTFFVITVSNFILMVMYHASCFDWFIQLLRKV